ncbi:MAG: hypothetical protein Q9209_003005 [Squamulea sp. 1 TL-2023]
MADQSTFFTAVSNPDLANEIMTDPVAAHLNLAIHELPSSLLTYIKEARVSGHDHNESPSFSLALHTKLAKSILYKRDQDIIAIIRACMQIIVVYSLKHNQYAWIGGEAHSTIEGLSAKIGLLLHFGTDVPASESSEFSMKANYIDAVMIFNNKGMVYKYFSTIIKKFIELDEMLMLRKSIFVMFQPKKPGQQKKMEMLSRLLKKGRDNMAGEACALLVHYPARYFGGFRP